MLHLRSTNKEFSANERTFSMAQFIISREEEIMTPQEIREAVKLLEKQLHSGIISYNEFEAKINKIMA